MAGSSHIASKSAYSASAECLSDDEVLGYLAAERDSQLRPGATAHVEICPGCQRLVAEAARSYLSGQAHNEPGQLRTLSVGDLVVGRYEIVRFIGAGGMGEVYEALDRELGETIALKTVALTTLDDQRALARLKAEVQLARRTTHPNVCRIFDFAVHLRARGRLAPEPVPLLTMELLSGETLARYLARRGRLSGDEARPIVTQMLAGLGAVHRAEIVHRDLKAENVFLVWKAGQTVPRVVLMDFGLARPALPIGPSNASFRHSLAGTATTIAPEQVAGRPVTFASDIYSLGVVMFEMVTGRLPFSGETAMELAFERLRTPPPRPSSLTPDLDPLWDVVILRCLARVPADRYQSVDEMARAFEERRSPRRGLLRRWWGLTASAVLGSGLIALAASRGGGNRTVVSRALPPSTTKPVASASLPSPLAGRAPVSAVDAVERPTQSATAAVVPRSSIRARPRRRQRAVVRGGTEASAPAASSLAANPVLRARTPTSPSEPSGSKLNARAAPRSAPPTLPDPDGIVNPFARH